MQHQKKKIQTYNKRCDELCTDIRFFISTNKNYGKEFKSRLNNLVDSKVTDISYIDGKKKGNVVKTNTILAISLKQKYDDVVLRCSVQHGVPGNPETYSFHCFAVVNLKGKGPKRSKNRRHVKCEMLFDYSMGKRRIWPFSFYENNSFASSHLGRKPVWTQDIPVLTSMNYEWLMYQTIEGNVFQRYYQWKIERGIYKKHYDASMMMSLLLKKKITIVKKKYETIFLQEDETCNCPKCKAAR